MNKKTLFAVGVVVVVIIGLLVFWNNVAERHGVIRIGAILPLTGDVAAYGHNTRKGIDLAVDEINQSGGVLGKHLQIVYEDSRADAKTGVTAMHRLIEGNVPAVIDNSVSSVALAIAPIADRNRVVVLSTGSTNPQLSGISPYFFRIWNSDDLEGRLSAQFVAQTLRMMRGAILYVNNDYGNGLREVFAQEFQAQGGEIVTTENYEQGTSDFRTQLARIRAANVEFLYIAGYSRENAVILIQTKEIGLDVQVVGTVTIEDRTIIGIAGEAANGVIYPFPKEPDETNPSVARFKENFWDFYQEKTAITCDVGYDAVYLIAKAIAITSSVDGECIQRGLREIKAFEGASGLIEFDENGNVNKPMQFKQIVDGVFVNFE